MDSSVMRIKIIGDDSISRQACTYAQYRLFAALSQVLDTGRVRSASLVLRRSKSRRHRDGVMCTVTVELNRASHTTQNVRRASVCRHQPGDRATPPELAV